MPASQKIITKLRERRQIEADLRQMLSAASAFEFQSQAQQIASQGSQVIPTIIGNLDGADSQMLGAMGAVASFLDPDEVGAALRQAMMQPQRTNRGRRGAMTILQHYLGQSFDETLLDGVQDSAETAITSLDRVLRQAVANSAVLVQYIEELDQQEPEVVLAMVDTLRERASSQEDAEEQQVTIALLRMMALDVRQEIAIYAVQALGALRTTESARALQTLLPILEPGLCQGAERAVRKLQFSGVLVEPLPQPDPGWRALIGPVSGRGHQSVWFFQTEQDGLARFLNVLLSDHAGAVEALGHTQVPMSIFPVRRSPGYLHDIALPDGSGTMLMLEAAFDAGRRLVSGALALNRETQIPVAGPLRFLSTWLWECAIDDAKPSPGLPGLPPRTDSLLADSDRLLAHPAFSSWTVRSSATFQAAEEALRHPKWDRGVWIRRLSSELFGEPEIRRVLSKRLELMSRWLLMAGDEERASATLAVADAILNSPLQEQPFLQAIISRDLEWALQTLQQNSDRT